MNRIALRVGQAVILTASVGVLLVGSCGRSQLTSRPVERDLRLVTVTCLHPETRQLLGRATVALTHGASVDLRCQDRMWVRRVPE